MDSLDKFLYDVNLCVLSHIQGHSTSWTVEEVQEDLDAVEQALLAFVTGACPEEQDRDFQHNAASCLIKFARDSPADIHQHNSESVGSKQASKKYPPDVLRSIRALQPLLGPEGISDALTVLRALHCRMQRPQDIADRQPEAQAPLMSAKAPEAHGLPPSTMERPVDPEATAQHSGAGSCMAERDAPVCSEGPGPDTAHNVSSSDTTEQQSAEQSQSLGKATSDRQLISRTQHTGAEEAQPDAQACLPLSMSCRQHMEYFVYAMRLASEPIVSND